MSSLVFDEAVIAYDEVGAAFDKMDTQDVSALSNAERIELLERRQRWRRRLAAGDHALLNEVARGSTEDLGGKPSRVLADRLRIYRRDAARRIEEAADLGPRQALTGEPLPPKLEATAAGQRAGLIGDEHVKVIRAFFAQLPSFIDETTKVEAECKLAAQASAYRPDELQQFARYLDLMLNPDGNFSDEDRARRRGITLSPQGLDGMSRICGWVNPELRAGFDAVLAKLAAPGMCNPADENPTVAGTPSQEAVDGDVRSPAHPTDQHRHPTVGIIRRSA